jgi:hypothetical protein
MRLLRGASAPLAMTVLEDFRDEFDENKKDEESWQLRKLCSLM